MGWSSIEGISLPVDFIFWLGCIVLSSWSIGWLDSEKIQISATLAVASLMLLKRLRTWPPSVGCCITWDWGSNSLIFKCCGPDSHPLILEEFFNELLWVCKKAQMPRSRRTTSYRHYLMLFQNLLGYQLKEVAGTEDFSLTCDQITLKHVIGLPSLLFC